MAGKMVGALSLTLLALAGLAVADTGNEHHALAGGAAVKWGPAPPALPPGASGEECDG